MKIPLPYEPDTNHNRNSDVSSIEDYIKLRRKTYFKYARSIDIVNADIFRIIGDAIYNNSIMLKLNKLSYDKTIIIYDKMGLVICHILQYISKYHVLDDCNICVVSDYLYPKYISQSLFNILPYCYDFNFIDTSCLINMKIIKNNINKIRFLLKLRDDFTKEFIKIDSEIKLLSHFAAHL